MLSPGLHNSAKEQGPATFDWWPDWRDRTVAIVACGPSAKTPDLELLHRIPVMVINESHQLCPWADVLYGCDAKWWRLRQYVREFKGLKLTFDTGTTIAHPEIKKVEINVHGNDILVHRPAYVGSGGNSGFQGLNLAVQFGAARILLIGFDMRVDLGTHWHGRHPPPLSNPCPRDNLPRWVKAFDGASLMLRALGVEVINCSPISALQAYPKMTIAQALM